MRKALAFSLMLFAMVYGISAQAASSKEAGVIKELTGQVEIKSAGKSAFTAARVGDKIAQDTIVSTGFKSTAVIEVGSSVITVRPLTRLSLAEIQSSAGTDTLNVSLQTGRVRVDVNPPAGTKANTVVRGPNATASVRGTSFEFDTVKLSVNHGKVAFQGASGPATMVNTGGTSSIEEDETSVDSSARITGTSRIISIRPSAPRS
jgi:hypothetical protein